MLSRHHWWKPHLMGDSSNLLPSSKALEQWFHQHGQASVICMAGTIVWVSSCAQRHPLGLLPPHLCPYTAKSGQKRVPAGESSFQ